MIFAHYGNLKLSNMNRQILMRHELDRQKQGSDKLLDGVRIPISARPGFDGRQVLDDAKKAF